MKKKKTNTILDCVEDLFKPFENSNGEIEISENINPALVMFIVTILGISKTFLLVLTDTTCPHCGKKLHKHQTVDFKLNNTVLMKKMTYKCSNSECGRVITPPWAKFIEAGCNYTKAVREYALELGLICNVSYEKMCEIIYWAHGVEISRDTLYKFRKKYFKDFIMKLRESLEFKRRMLNIKCSNVLSYDEQYVKVMGEWVYKLTAMDPVTGHIYDFCIATKDEFNQDYVKNFLKPIVGRFNIKVIVTDGAKMYGKIMKELDVEHKVCNFHKMQNLMRKMLGKLISYNKKINNLKKEIEENNDRIKEIAEMRQGKVGRPSKEEQPLVDEKHSLERENREKRSEIREHKKELKLYEDTKDQVSLMLRSKTKETGYKRYYRLLDRVDELPEETRGFIKKMEKDLDILLLHTEYDDVPTTNDSIELYHLTTLNRHDKKKYKTIEGVYEEVLLKNMRWEKRVVLGMA